MLNSTFFCQIALLLMIQIGNAIMEIQNCSLKNFAGCCVSVSLFFFVCYRTPTFSKWTHTMRRVDNPFSCRDFMPYFFTAFARPSRRSTPFWASPKPMGPIYPDNRGEGGPTDGRMVPSVAVRHCVCLSSKRNVMGLFLLCRTAALCDLFCLPKGSIFDASLTHRRGTERSTRARGHMYVPMRSFLLPPASRYPVGLPARGSSGCVC